MQNQSYYYTEEYPSLSHGKKKKKDFLYIPASIKLSENLTTDDMNHFHNSHHIS